jgi:hypothetical protein
MANDMDTNTSENVKMIQETLQNAMKSGTMDAKAMTKMTGHICLLINSYVDLREDAVASKNRTAYKSANVVVSELETLYEDEERDEAHGVLLHDDQILMEKVSEFAIKKKRAHLFVICSVHKGVIMIEYASKKIPEFTSSFVCMPKNGVVYMTCNSCLRSKMNKTGAPRETDWTRQGLFLQGQIEPDPEEYASLCKGVNPYIAKFPRMIMCRNKPAYITQDIMERHTTDEDVIMNVNVDLDTSWYGNPIFSEYVEGSFLRI